ncbi:MAG: hypothetical protein ACI923_001935 [Flavobacteriales bacterium]|jgi:hypothetical protein
MLNYLFTSVRKLLIVGCLFIGSMAFGQSPFDGFVIQPVPIPPAVASSIQTVAGFTSIARTWRVYVCMNADNWELQGLAGIDLNPWTIECPGCSGTTNFYNNLAFGGFQGDLINPGFYFIDANMEFDSWFFIGEPVFPSGNAGVQWFPSVDIDPSVAFEGGGDFMETSNIGSVLGGFWTPPSTQGKADTEYKVLIAQLTTDGIFEGQMILQFRRLNPINELYLPLSIINEYDVTFTNNPGFFDETCPQVFLPVELIEFNAAPSDDRVNVLWKTASERNAENFTVEHSLDLENWSDIGTLPASGNSDQEETYFLAHKEPTVGVNYYRLRQKDHNGAMHHSDARSAVFKASEITFYPNPASDRVWFKGDLSQVSVINVYDMHGRLVLQQTGNQDVIREMDINSLERGAYVVEFIYPDGTSFRDKLQVIG